MAESDPRTRPIAIIGAGAAGLITAQTLLQDGFKDVQIFTRDQSPGGVWARGRVYPGLRMNNVHGEFRFSPLPMAAPTNSPQTGGRLSGYDMQAYLEKFAEEFLKDKIRYETEVLNIERDDAAVVWFVKIQNKKSDVPETLKFSKVVLCTGGCSNPDVPLRLSPDAAKLAGFRGLVLHSQQYNEKLDEILSTVKPISADDSAGPIVIIGGGKSAQDIAAYLANQGRRVSIVFETGDAFVVTAKPLPNFIRKSRLLPVLSPYYNLRTRAERFLHTTWLGAKIVNFFWKALAESSFSALKIPKDSSLRLTQSNFWGVRINDEGVVRPDGFHSLVNAGKIDLVASARVEGFSTDGRSLVLDNGKSLAADVVILATGYKSSWANLFSEKAAEDLGIKRHPPKANYSRDWNYTSLSNPPPSRPENEQWASSIYRGLVPAKNINRRDFAVNGSIFTTNNGYVFEVSAHWISSYFLGDNMRLPSSPEEALAHAERMGSWMRKRYPGTLLYSNESYSSGLVFWNWPQMVDELLEDMRLRSMRSGGNSLTWIFKVIDLDEISTLSEERRINREKEGHAI